VSEQPTAPAGVIHDIGYRHYQGAVLGRSYLVRSLYLDTLRGCYGLGRSIGSKVMPALLLAAMLMPAVVMGVVTNVTGAKELPIPYTRFAIALQLVISIYVAGQAPGAVSRDLRFRTVALYFSRPLTRGDYVLAKFAALSSAIFLLIALPLTVLYASALLAKLAWWPQTRGWLLGLTGAVMFSVVLAGIGLVIAAITPRRGLGVAAIIATLLLLSIIAQIGKGITAEQGHRTAASYFGLLDPFSVVDGAQVWLLRAQTSTYIGPAGTLGGVVFTAAVPVLALACVGLLLLRYRRVSLS
jgi:ABC-2 type transport system permease protein